MNSWLLGLNRIRMKYSVQVCYVWHCCHCRSWEEQRDWFKLSGGVTEHDISSRGPTLPLLISKRVFGIFLVVWMWILMSRD